MSARRFTGRHMWAVMVGFFGVVIAVNFTMAWFASNSFGGTVVDNSYVASQKFNGWLAASRAQARLGWTTDLSLDATRHPVLLTGGSGFTATGTAHHPLGGAADVPLAFVAAGDGRLVAVQALPGGRWLVRVAVNRDGETLRLAETLQ
ncbi:MAG: FixH family protein [Polymorphobacter sp.]